MCFKLMFNCSGGTCNLNPCSWNLLMYLGANFRPFLPFVVYNLLHRNQEHALFHCDLPPSSEQGIKISFQD